jgi:hypothetical protein
MRSCLLARVAALVLAAGGLLVIPASPAFAHCQIGDHPHPDRQHGGAPFRWEGRQAGGTPVRHGPHDAECDPFMIAFAGDGIDPHCGPEVPGGNNWLYADVTGFGEGWARDGQLRLESPVLLVFIPGCNNPDNEVAFNGFADA